MAGSQRPAGTSPTQEAVVVKAAARLLMAAALTAFLSACRSTPSEAELRTFTTCRETFQRWVDGDAALNEPGADIVAVAAAQEHVQRRVFELCGLAEAEMLNKEILPKRPAGTVERMIDPDMKTFATVECVDEAPLLDGTRLCAEVGR